MTNLIAFKEIFDPILKLYLDKKINTFSKDITDSFLLDIINYPQTLITSGGKRIRPFIAYLMYQALGGKETEKALEFMVCLELFHNFALVHDDIMDKDSMRHGVKTIHEYVKEKLQADKRNGDLIHIGNSQAILLGDLLLTWAFSVFDESSFDKDKLKEAKSFFNKMANDVILGQMIDVDIVSRNNTPRELIDKKDRLKTASYSFIRPLQIGAALVKIDEEIEKFCEELGLNLGLAFQLQDDLLDSENTETKQEILKKIEEYLDVAQEIVTKSNLSDNYKEEFYRLINTLRNRKN